MNHIKLSLLGSTGSIGTQTLDVARLHGFSIVALAADKNVILMERQIREFKPRFVAMRNREAARDLRVRVADMNVIIAGGEEAVCAAAEYEFADMILNAVVGIAGLKPTISAIKAEKKLALANKETLVAGGSLVVDEAKKHGVNIIPVDSEHSAIFQCLHGYNRDSIKKIILTASGGPFYGMKKDELENITPEMALKHPNWSMGAKVSVDSSTLMNKGLELIEAKWLFGVALEQIEIVVHRQSIIHSMVEYQDNAVIAQLGMPDMRIPIQYAITYPDRVVSLAKEMRLTDYSSLTFSAPDMETFRCLPVCIKAAMDGGLRACAANAANEEAVRLFLEQKIKYLHIADIIEYAASLQNTVDAVTLDNIYAADKQARINARCRANALIS